MNRITEPVSLPELTDIDEVERLSESDQACFDDIREALRKHGKLQRFGVTLLHSHFPVQDDENNCVTNISINNYGNITILGCNCGEAKPTPSGTQTPICDCIPTASGHKAKRSLADRLKPLLRDAVPSVVTGAFVHALRRYISGTAAANAFEKSIFTHFSRLSPAVQDVLECVVKTYDGLEPDVRKELFADIANGDVAIPVNPDRLIEPLKDEIRQREVHHTFSREECFDDPSPGLRRPRNDGEFGESARPMVCKINGLRTADFKPDMMIDEYNDEEKEQVCEVNTSETPPSLECRPRTIAEDVTCPGRNVDETCLTVPEVMPGEEVLLEGVNFYNSDATIVFSPRDGDGVHEVSARICGDLVTPLQEVVGGSRVVIDDCRVNDQLVFVIPSDIAPGVFELRVSFVDHESPDGRTVQSTPQFVRVVPSRDTAFRLTVDELVCTEETDGLGSDEVALTFFTGSIGRDGTVSPPSIITRRFDDVDSGESRDLDELLFTGSNFNAVFVSVTGFEVDNERAYREQIESTGEAFILFWTILFDAIADIEDYTGETVSALVLIHGWWGGLTSIFTQALATFWALYAPADLIMNDRMVWSAAEIGRALRDDVPLPERSAESENGIDVSISLQTRRDGQYFEQRTYRSEDEDSTYRITYRLE